MKKYIIMRFLNNCYSYLFIFLSSILFSFDSVAQYSLNKSYDNIEIRGNITSIYKGRWYPDSANYTLSKQHKNLMRLKDARVRLKGSSMKKKFNYELHLDFANLADQSNSPELPILDGYVTYNGPLDITVGYTKLPISRESMTPIIYSPWLKRSMIIDEGQSRRDLGVHLEKGIFSDKINFYTSFVNGLTEISKQQDDSLGYELISRIDFAYPSKMKYRAINISRSALPILSLGVSYRQSHKGEFHDADDETIWTGIDGLKQSLSYDFAVKFKGISLLIERHQINYEMDPIFIGNLSIPPQAQVNYPNYPYVRDDFKTKGKIVQLSYYHKKWRSVYSIRYDDANINYLEKDNELTSYDESIGKNEKTIGFAYNYRFNSHLSVFKLQLTRTVFAGFDKYGATLDYSLRPKMYELRVGFQYIIG